MLEDPSYASIVRWGDEGDSFVVLEVNAPIPPPPVVVPPVAIATILTWSWEI